MRRGLIIICATTVTLGAAIMVGVARWRARERGKLISVSLAVTPQLDRLPDAARSRLVESLRRAQSGDVPALAEASRLFHANGLLSEAAHCYRALERLEP